MDVLGRADSQISIKHGKISCGLNVGLERGQLSITEELLGRKVAAPV
jgi:hypothetical protein